MRYEGARATYTVEEMGKKLGIGRNAAYEAARRGDFPTMKIGRLIRVPKTAADKLLETGKTA
jgi:excisionase family DNA binding protein